MRPTPKRRRRRMKRRVYRVINPKRLDVRMDEVGMSSSRLGRAAGHSDHSYIARMRRGEPRARSVTKATAEAIATALAVPVDYLFEEIDPSTGHPIQEAAVAPTTGTSVSTDSKTVVTAVPA